jgi:hypothetical protein
MLGIIRGKETGQITVVTSKINWYNLNNMRPETAGSSEIKAGLSEE